MSTQIKKLEPKVKALLEMYPQFRDDDNALTAYIWEHEQDSNLNIRSFFQAYAKGTVTRQDYVTRVRRKLQEAHPELRGVNYDKRQAHIPKVREDLGYITNQKSGGFTP
jgi:hypothetical protein